MAGKKICSGCRNEINSRRYLVCSLCDQVYDLICANVSEQRFYNTLDAEHRKTWKCPCCICNKPKTNNINTPVRPATQNEENANVTLRKNCKSNKLPPVEPTAEMEETSVAENVLNDESLLGETITPRISHILPCRRETPSGSALTLDQISTLLDRKLEQNENKIVKLLENAIKSLVKQEIQDSIKQLNNEVTQRIESVTNKHHHLESEIDNLNQKITLMKEEITRLNSQLDTVRNTENINTEKGKKLVFFGLEEHKWETEDELHHRLVNIIRDFTNINIDGYIESVKRLGRNRYRRPIVIELIGKKMVKMVLNCKRAFARSGMAVSEFLENDDLQKHNELRKLLHEARKEGHHAVIRNNSLIINGRQYNNQLHESNSQTSIQQTTSRTHDTTEPATSTASNKTQTKSRTNHSFRN